MTEYIHHIQIISRLLIYIHSTISPIINSIEAQILSCVEFARYASALDYSGVFIGFMAVMAAITIPFLLHILELVTDIQKKFQAQISKLNLKNDIGTHGELFITKKYLIRPNLLVSVYFVQFLTLIFEAQSNNFLISLLLQLTFLLCSLYLLYGFSRVVEYIFDEDSPGEHNHKGIRYQLRRRYLKDKSIAESEYKFYILAIYINNAYITNKLLLEIQKESIDKKLAQFLSEYIHGSEYYPSIKPLFKIILNQKVDERYKRLFNEQIRSIFEYSISKRSVYEITNEIQSADNPDSNKDIIKLFVNSVLNHFEDQRANNSIGFSEGEFDFYPEQLKITYKNENKIVWGVFRRYLFKRFVKTQNEISDDYELDELITVIIPGVDSSMFAKIFYLNYLDIYFGAPSLQDNHFGFGYDKGFIKESAYFEESKKERKGTLIICEKLFPRVYNLKKLSTLKEKFNSDQGEAYKKDVKKVHLNTIDALIEYMESKDDVSK